MGSRIRLGLGLAIACCLVLAAVAFGQGAVPECNPFSPTSDGTAGDDICLGTDGADRFSLGAGNDRLVAGPGNDVITAVRGRDRVDAGPGNDQIQARDDTRDVVHCGPGFDRFFGDPGDRTRGCEKDVRF